MDKIIIRGAREHNLQNIDLEIPREKLVVITGVSGSGKSSLAFDTLFAEGQRRYVESLSAYARQFLQQMEKPDVDGIEGLSPAISIEQKTVSKNPRSTVGTVTEIQDYLRLLYASIGVPHCPSCGEIIRPQTVQQMVDRVLAYPEGTRLILYGPYVRGKKGEYKTQLEQMVREGFVRARIDGEIVDLSGEVPRLDKKLKHTIELVVDRLKIKQGIERRLTDSLETALKVGGGLVLLAFGEEEELWSEHYACTSCGTSLAEITPRLFSFNSPFGACSTCSGLGTLRRVDPNRLIGDPRLSIGEGALTPWSGGSKSWRLQMVETLITALGFGLDIPWQSMPEEVRHAILHGNEQELNFSLAGKKSSYQWKGRYEGIVPMFERRYRDTDSTNVRREIEKYMMERCCPACEGRRLKPEALAVEVDGKPIDTLTALPIWRLRKRIDHMMEALSERDREIARKILREIHDRLRFLDDVGVGYLSLERRSGTLSGGESQRIRLATQIGSRLMGVLYVLDEPSIGLHQRDNARLLKTLKEMRDLGNTVIVVEHDEETIREADWIVDLGPGAGCHGGEVVAAGTPDEVISNGHSLTGKYLRGDLRVEIPERRTATERSITIRGAAHNNLKDLDVTFPLGLFTVVTGVSGSGKSSLVNDTLHRELSRHFHHSLKEVGRHQRVEGLEYLDKVIAIDQSPIGRTPRSNPATYTKVFTHIRTLMAQTPEARVRGYKPGRFSFNVKGGRCEACRGDGQLKIEMHFLADVYVTCEVCGGHRYGRETLTVHYKGLNIAEILELSVEEALEVFRNIPSIERILRTLFEVGLGYIRLGQPATTLSGGEAQRVKLATELCKRSTGRTLYLLDEPTTGLHVDDVKKLLSVLHRLVEKGNTVIVVEHNLDVIKTADWIIDLGPEGGEGGGELVAQGSPESVAATPGSHTGEWLRNLLDEPIDNTRREVS